MTSITWTELPNKSGASMTRKSGSWPELLHRVETVGKFRDKDHCPWLKLVTFGNKRSRDGSLRTNENILSVHGLEGDHDGETVSLDAAIAMLEKHGIRAAIYPSASNLLANPPRSHGGPRWRVICPLSEPCQPEDRKMLMARLNGALGGILANESFTLSQGFYFGDVGTNDYRVLATFDDPNAGQCIDTLGSLDDIAIGKRGGDVAAAPVTENIFADEVERAGRLLITGDGRRELLKSYIASRSGRGVQPDDLRLLVAGVAATYFDPQDPIGGADVDLLIAHFAAKDATEGFTDPETGTESDPLDMFSTHPAPSAFATDDYPPTIAALATDIALRMGCDPKIPAWSALVACAALVPDEITLRTKAHDYTWRESARIWVAHVGPPSSKKSPPMAAVLAPVHQVQKRAYAKFQQRLDEWELLAAEAKREKLPEPKRPTLERILVGDATTEALVTVCRENSAGVLVVHDELTGFFGAMDAYRQNGATKDRALWLQTFNGGPFLADRVGKGPMHVSNLSACMLGGIQPDPMRRIAGKLDDDGLLQRFIVLSVSSATDGLDRAPNAAALSAWDDLVQELASRRCNPMDEWPTEFRLSPDAQKAADTARARISAMARNPGVDVRLAAALAKGEGQLIRLILTFHAIEDRTQENVFDYGKSPAAWVSLKTANRVIRLYFNLVVPSLHAFYGDLIGVSPTHEHARWVAGFILASGSSMLTERDISRAYRSLRGDNAKREIADCMSLLELASWVAPIERPGKAPKSWTVNPKVHILFADRAIKERERRDRERAEISRAAKEVANSL